MSIGFGEYFENLLHMHREKSSKRHNLLEISGFCGTISVRTTEAQALPYGENEAAQPDLMQ